MYLGTVYVTLWPDRFSNASHLETTILMNIFIIAEYVKVEKCESLHLIYVAQIRMGLKHEMIWNKVVHWRVTPDNKFTDTHYLLIICLGQVVQSWVR